MSNTKHYIASLFAQNKMDITKAHAVLFEEFIKKEINIQAVKSIQENQQTIMGNWKIQTKINDIIEKQLIIPNGTVDKAYHAELDFSKMGFENLAAIDLQSLQEYGLTYDNTTNIISGIPMKSGDFKVEMGFKIKDEAESNGLHIKLISLIINADPKSLWKDIPSTELPDNFWKPDRAFAFEKLGEKHIVVASTRGRSHANVGSFRDDDFAYKNFVENGWSVVCVADGAGGYPLSRQGSKLACGAVVEYFEQNFTAESLKDFDKDLSSYVEKKEEEFSKR